MNAPWLFAEAYKYRRLHECFSISKYWKDYDVFFRQKVREALIELGQYSFVTVSLIVFPPVCCLLNTISTVRNLLPLRYRCI